VMGGGYSSDTGYNSTGTTTSVTQGSSVNWANPTSAQSQDGGSASSDIVGIPKTEMAVENNFTFTNGNMTYGNLMTIDGVNATIDSNYTGGGGGSITVENSYTATNKKMTSWTVSSVVVPVSSDAAIYVMIGCVTKNNGDAKFVSGITWNLAPFTMVGEYQNVQATVAIWKLLLGDFGSGLTRDLIVTFDDNNADWEGFHMAVEVLSGVDQTTPDDGWETPSTGSGTSATHDVTTQSGDLNYGVVTIDGASSLTENGDGTELSTGTGSGNHRASTVKFTANDSTTSFSYGIGATEPWIFGGVSINPAAGGGGGSNDINVEVEWTPTDTVGTMDYLRWDYYSAESITFSVYDWVQTQYEAPPTASPLNLQTYPEYNSSTNNVKVRFIGTDLSTAFSLDIDQLMVNYTVSPTISDWMRATNFSFNILTTATIDGIVVEIDRHADQANSIRDDVIQLIKTSGPVGDDKATAAWWDTNDDSTYNVYGGVADNWNAGLAPSDINDIDFGVNISAENVGLSNTANIDHVRIKVYYTVADSLQSQEQWETPNNANAQDDSETYVVFTEQNQDSSDWIRLTNFGFNIPASASINGIKVEMDRFVTQALAIQDGAIFLRNTTGQVGNDKSTGADWDIDDNGIYTVFGGLSDLWGKSWTVAEINSSQFGIDLYIEYSGSGDVNANLDHLQITVNYTMPDTLYEMPAQPDDFTIIEGSWGSFGDLEYGDNDISIIYSTFRDPYYDVEVIVEWGPGVEDVISVDYLYWSYAFMPYPSPPIPIFTFDIWNYTDNNWGVSFNPQAPFELGPDEVDENNNVKVRISYGNTLNDFNLEIDMLRLSYTNGSGTVQEPWVTPSKAATQDDDDTYALFNT
ncbi:hypothetical protein LCGC14_1843470, partial [marine sediment metagenome]